VSRIALERAISEAIQGAGLQNLSSEELAKFEAYLALLLKWNSRLNLTAVREPEAIIRRHFVECVQCAQILPALPERPTLLDFGSGAGLPGIPIAICRPEIRVTLAESQGKKAAFLREAVRTLDLKSEIFDGRVEAMAPGRCFSVVTLRAIDKMSEACRTAAARIAAGDWIAVFATGDTEAGLKAALPEIEWRNAWPIPTLDKGKILVGQRR
jgi:16S rRNA (guanine527-N7)-methyltransferase